MFERERLAQQWVVQQIDLSYGQIIGGAPPGVEARQVLGAEGCVYGGGLCDGGHGVLGRLRTLLLGVTPAVAEGSDQEAVGGWFRAGARAAAPQQIVVQFL